MEAWTAAYEDTFYYIENAIRLKKRYELESLSKIKLSCLNQDKISISFQETGNAD